MRQRTRSISLSEGATAGEARAQGEARARDDDIIFYNGDGWEPQTGSTGIMSRAGLPPTCE